MHNEREGSELSDLWRRRFIAVARILTGCFLLMSGVSKLGGPFAANMDATLQFFAHGNPALNLLTLSNGEFKPLVDAHPELKFVTVDANPMFRTLAAGHPEGWYKQFLIRRVIPHAQTFAWVVTWGEIIIGLMLTIGLGTGLAGLIAIFMHLNYHLATSWMGGASAFVNMYAMLMVLLLVATAAGRTWGVDRWLAKKVPVTLLW